MHRTTRSQTRLSRTRLFRLALTLGFTLLSVPAPVYAQSKAAPPAKFRVWLIEFQDISGQIEKTLRTGVTQAGSSLEFVQNVSSDKLLAALQGGDPPELVMEADPGTMGTLAREGFATPLEPYIKRGGIDVGGVDVADIVPATLGQCRYYGKLYCLPWGTDTLALLWNRDAFKKAGLPDRAPVTLEELAAFAKKLNITDARGNLSQVGFVPNFAWSHTDLYSMLFGGNFFSGDGTKVTVGSGAVAQALAWQSQFYTGPGVDKVARLSSGFGDGAQDGFVSGKVAMAIHGEWIPGTIKESRPNLRYGVAPIPYPAAHPERKGLTILGGTVVFLPSGNAHRDFTWKVVSWMQRPQVLTDAMVAGGNLPTSKKGLTDPRLRADPRFAVFTALTSSPNAKAFPVSLIGAEFRTAFGAIEEKAVRGKLGNVAAALKGVQTSLQLQLDKALATPPK